MLSVPINKIILFFILIILSFQLFALTNETGIIKGKLFDKKRNAKGKLADGNKGNKLTGVSVLLNLILGL